MNPILQGILLGTGQGAGAIAGARKEQEDKALRARAIGTQEEANRIAAEKGTVEPATLTTFYEALGLPVPSNLAGMGRIPEGMATKAMDAATKQAEVQRGLTQGREVVEDMRTQYGRTVPQPDDPRPGPLNRVIDDPYLNTILTTVSRTGLTDKTAPQVEAYGKLQSERAEEERKYQRGQQALRDFGILPQKPGTAPGTAPAPSGGGAAGNFRWTPKIDAKGGVGFDATAPTDDRNALAQAKYGGRLFHQLDPAEQQGVLDEEHRRKVVVSREQGAAGVTAKAAAEAGLPLYQSKKEGQHVVDVKADAEVDYFATKGADLEKNSKNYKLLSGDQYKQWVAIKEMEGIFTEFERIAPQLVKQPGMNKVQQLEMWAKNSLGVPGLQTDLAALKGATLRVARAMQGSSQNLSDADRKTVEGMLPTSEDTADSAIRKLAQAYRVFGHMKAAVLGQSRAAERAREAVGETQTAPPPGFRKAP